MSDYGERLKADYEASRPKYDQFTSNLSELIECLLTGEGIEHLPIQSRTKGIESFFNKVERPDKSQKYVSCSDLTDLSGIRIISYLQEDRNKICELIERSFKIDAKNSSNKDELLDADQFGYRSTHYVVSYTDERIVLPEFQKFQDLKAEIQVRTLLQHTWAEIDWKIRYKNKFEAPKALRRQLYRISALLELADDQFSELSRDIENIRKSYQEKIADGDLHIEVNRELIELFLVNNQVIEKLVLIAEKSGFIIAPFHPDSRNPYNTLLATLALVEITSIDQLRNMLKKFTQSEGKSLKAIFDAWSGPGKPSKLVSDVSGLIRICTVLSSQRERAKEVLRSIPFGPELQKSIRHVMS